MVILSKKNLVALIGITTTAMLGVVAGCSGDDSSGVTNPGGDSGTVDDGSSGGDGSKSGDGGTGSETGGPTEVKTGNVTFNQTSIAAAFSTSGTAYFYVAPVGYDADCVGFSTVSTPSAAESACTIKVCTNPISNDAGTIDAGDAGDAGPVVLPNSGDITLKTALDTTGTVITANADGTYTPATGVVQLWAAADNTGEVKSNGSATSIAAFDDTALITPGNVTTPKLGDTDVSSPAVSTTTFDRGTNLPVTYSSGVTGTKLTVRLTTTSTTRKAIISCDFDAANGAESIASADLANLDQAGTGGVTGAYSVQARSIKSTTSSGFTFDVILSANNYAGSFTNGN